jgi:cytochrome P450
VLTGNSHETTSSAVCWASYLLAKHPDVQEKVREEIRAALPLDSALESTADVASVLEKLPYLNGVMHETLRLYPTAPLTMRRAIRDTRVGDRVIPKGTTFVVSIWMLHRSPEVWGPGAAEFRPERWIEADGRPNRTGGARSNYEFLTFLQGPRSCIGQDFVRAEMRCLLAALAGAFSWELSPGEEDVIPTGIITIKPENGLRLIMKPVQDQASS